MNSNDCIKLTGTVKNRRTKFAALILSGLLASCGGEDITETDLSSQLQSPVAEDIVDDTLVDAAPGQLPDTISIRPQVELGPRRFADSNVLINIEADVTAVEGSAIASSLWTQASGPQIQLPSVNTNSLIMITPFVATTRVLEFRHTVMDDQDRINSKTVSVVVRPLDSPIAVIGGVFNELDQVANFSIRLSEASDTPVTINYVTRNGTAEAGDDFEFTSGTVVIPPGTLSTDVSVPLIDDNIAEEDETFSLQAISLGSDGGSDFANTGPAIIRNGSETAIVEQIIEFRTDPVNITIAGTFTNAFSEGNQPRGDGALLYISSAPEVATVDANGLVTAISAGTATITVTKDSDEMFSSGEASYLVQVMAEENTPPTIRFTPSGFGRGISFFLPGDTSSITGRAGPDIFPVIRDTEDGNLPTEAQLSEFESTGIPIPGYRWSSDIDGDLGDGHLFPPVILTIGRHQISFTATDSDGAEGTRDTPLLVSNIAPLSRAGSTGRICVLIAEDTEDCYDASDVVDTDFYRGFGASWAVDGVSDEPQQIRLTWPQNVRINEIELHTPEGREIKDFVIEGQRNDGEPVQIANVTGNTDALRSFPLVNVNVSSITVLITAGPDVEPDIAEINEIVVFGSVLLDQNIAFSNPGPIALIEGDTNTNIFATEQAPLGTGALIYTSSNPEVASVDESGAVVALTTGNTTITATKLSDEVYQAGAASYIVNVTSANTPPTIEFLNANNGVIESASPISEGDLIDINPRITDEEDGSLPTEDELAEFAATGVPLSNYSWSSSLDGDLGNGHIFPDTQLQRGRHTITFSATDSGDLVGVADIPLFIGNIARLASPEASSIYCTDPRDQTTCYFGFNAINGLISTGSAAEDAWAADVSDGEQALELFWSSTVIIRELEIYTTEGLEISDFTVDILDNDRVVQASLPISENTETVITFENVNALAASIRIRAIRGSLAEPNIARINEVVVFGQDDVELVPAPVEILR